MLGSNRLNVVCRRQCLLHSIILRYESLRMRRHGYSIYHLLELACMMVIVWMQIMCESAHHREPICICNVVEGFHDASYVMLPGRCHLFRAGHADTYSMETMCRSRVGNIWIPVWSHYEQLSCIGRCKWHWQTSRTCNTNNTKDLE